MHTREIRIEEDFLNGEIVKNIVKTLLERHYKVISTGMEFLYPSWCKIRKMDTEANNQFKGIPDLFVDFGTDDCLNGRWVEVKSRNYDNPKNVMLNKHSIDIHRGFKETIVIIAINNSNCLYSIPLSWINPRENHDVKISNFSNGDGRLAYTINLTRYPITTQFRRLKKTEDLDIARRRIRTSFLLRNPSQKRLYQYS